MDRPFEVLVVDDSATSRLKIAAAVRSLGHSVVEADGGNAALSLLSAGGIDLVLLDIVMPEVDGFDVLRVMGEDARMSEIPVLVISSLEEMSEIVEAINLGAVDFLPKNVDPSLLNARVSACLEKKRLRDLELAYLNDVAHLTESARIVRATDFNPARLKLDAVTERGDSLGELARVFTHMAGEVHRREVAYRNQIDLLKGGFLILIMGLITGLYPVLSKVLARTSIDQPVGMAAWIGLVAACIALVGTLMTTGVPQITWPKIRFALVIGPFAALLPQTALIFASEHVNAIVISIILALTSLIVYLVSTILRIERPDVLRFLGILMGLIAVLLILRPGSEALVLAGAGLWVLLIFVAPCSVATESLLMLLLPTDKAGEWEVVLFAMVGSAAWGWGASAAMGWTLPLADIDQTSGLMLLAFATISAVATWLLALAVRKTGAIFASQYTYVTTIMGVVWSIVFLSETANIWIWVSLACMIVGMALVRPKQRAADFVPEQEAREHVGESRLEAAL